VRYSLTLVLDLARTLGIWLVVGSAHRLSKGRKPHNSVYVINESGEILDRYDTRICSGDADAPSGDLAPTAQATIPVLGR
jgi:deaminated glutathione amidase